MTCDPFTILLRHNHWANRVLLGRCEPLAHDQFHRKFPIGLESLHDTIDHIVGCLEGWTARVRGEERSRSSGPQTVAQLRERNNSSTRAAGELIDQLARSNTLGRQVTCTFDATAGGSVDFTFTAGSGMVHALVHGTHHRAQALNMLRHLNLGQPLPELDVSDWQYEVENSHRD